MPAPLPPLPPLLPPVVYPPPQAPAARHALPLQGITVLLVEDSRFASEALRLLCQRSGARLRRAETLAAAHAHLRVYRPDVVIIDLGLPDGRGEGLIRELALSLVRPGVIFGTSGDPGGARGALAAGADGFLEKPVAGLRRFIAALLPHLPDRRAADPAPPDPPPPDPLALHDDLARAEALLARGPDADGRRYVAGFVAGLARHAGDTALAAAARQAGDEGGIDRLSTLVRNRLSQAPGAFASRASAEPDRPV